MTDHGGDPRHQVPDEFPMAHCPAHDEHVVVCLLCAQAYREDIARRFPDNVEVARRSCAEGHTTPDVSCLDCAFLAGATSQRLATENAVATTAATEARRVAAAREVMGAPDPPPTDDDLERGKAAVLDHLGGKGVPVDVLELGDRLASGAVTLDEARAALGLPPVGSPVRRVGVGPAFFVGLAFVFGLGLGGLFGFYFGAAL